jgi:hypothetical protein
MDEPTDVRLAKQIALSTELWKTARYQVGIDEGAPVRVEVFLYAEDLQAAESLAARYHEDGWEVRVAEAPDGEKLPVKVITPEVAFSRAMILSLTEMMFAAGVETGCELDGLEIGVPTPRPWWKFW